MNTNGLAMLSPNRLKEIKRLLISFAAGKVPIQQIQRELQGYLFLNFTFAPNQRKIEHGAGVDLSRVIRVPIGTRHLSHMLKTYLADEITELDLSDWAAFVFMSELFVAEEESEQIQELVWDTIQRLMTPFVFDGLNKSVAQRYLESLQGTDS